MAPFASTAAPSASAAPLRRRGAAALPLLLLLGRGVAAAGEAAAAVAGAGASYNEATTLFKSHRGCDCQCAYLGGMCRPSPEPACCVQVCCGPGAMFPSGDLAPVRAMLQGPGIQAPSHPDVAAPVVNPIAPSRGMLQGAVIGSSSAGSTAAVNPMVYNQEMSVSKSAGPCQCKCSYLGGMCRTTSLDSCCQDVCCGNEADFPVAPSREMLNGPGLAPAVGAAVSSQESLGPAYQQEMRLSKSARGCAACECSYLGGMCRTTSLDACCQDVCCGHEAEFPLPALPGFGAIAPSRAMLLGVGPRARFPSHVKPSTTTTTSSTTTSTTMTSTSTTHTSTTVTTTTVTTTTVTITSTSTTTTTPYCFDHGSSWSPDMKGEGISHEKDAHACQARCANTSGCMHFSFFEPLGNCQIQDSFALRHVGLPGYTSGPLRCWSYMNHTAFVEIDNETILPRDFACLEPGVAWTPSMRSPLRIDGESEEVVHACRYLCADTKGCEHFTVMLPSMCHLVDSHAARVVGVELSVSGAVSGNCESAHVLDDVLRVVMRKEASDEQGDLQEVRSPRGGKSAAILAVLSVLGAASTLLVAGISSYRRRRSGPTRSICVPLRTDDTDAADNLAAAAGDIESPLE